MKFNEERWRILAENKPGELHSYIPQSSICELFDEIERLEREIAKCKEANEDAQSRLPCIWKSRVPIVLFRQIIQKLTIAERMNATRQAYSLPKFAIFHY